MLLTALPQQRIDTISISVFYYQQKYLLRLKVQSLLKSASRKT